METFKTWCILYILLFLMVGVYGLTKINDKLKVLACHELNAEVEAFQNCLSDK